MGRSLQKTMNQEEQIALFMPILEGTDGVEKMSKSLGNYIGINEEANVMFKKVMEIPDSLIIKYFNLATDEHPDKIEEVKKQLKEGKNPRDIKFELAKIITSLYHSKDELNEAIKFYNEAFVKKGIPEEIPEILVSDNNLLNIISEIVKNGFVTSGSEFRRLVKQRGVRLNGEVLNDLNSTLSSGDVLKIGKKKFIKIIIK